MQGLPVCVTLSLTVIASSMKKKNILCKSLATVESLGCVDVICSDKVRSSTLFLTYTDNRCDTRRGH